jgi:regulator of protease activity HflC (stomatin/prohibitin superfamily)
MLTNLIFSPLLGLLDSVSTFLWAVLFLYVVYKFVRSIRIVPARSAYIVERLGKYHRTLGAGFHPLVPFIDAVAYIQDLKEETIPVAPQECFTKDNVKVEVDGVIYLAVADPVNASYGITDYRFAAIQLAQTTTRSVIGTLALDQTFEERDLVSSKVVTVLAEVGLAWGIKVYRYEVKNVVPPPTVQNAMEQQVRAERERRAIVARSEGDMQSRINRSEGLKTELVNKSEGEMQRRVNEAEGRAQEIRAVAEATAQSIETVAAALSTPGGEDAIRLQLSGRYLDQLSALAKEGTQIVLPADLTRPDDLLRALDLGPRRP